MEKTLSHNLLIRITVVGDSYTGKSSLVQRYVNDYFDENYINTIWVDFKTKTIEIDGSDIDMQIWETCSREQSQVINYPYYRKTHGFILLYDTTNRESFFNLRGLLLGIIEHCQIVPCKIVIGSKSDLESRKIVSFEEGKALADEIGAKFIEVSALSSVNIDLAFESMARDILACCEV